MRLEDTLDEDFVDVVLEEVGEDLYSVAWEEAEDLVDFLVKKKKRKMTKDTICFCMATFAKQMFILTVSDLNF